jgi:hypothetical protein
VSLIEEMRKAYTIFYLKPEGKRALVVHKARWAGLKNGV